MNSSLRANFLFVVSILVIAGSLLSIVANTEYFPFSSYPMYAEPIEEIRVVRIVGTDDNNNHFLLPVLPAFAPMFERSLAQAIFSLHKNHGQALEHSIAALELKYQQIAARKKLRNAKNIYWVEYEIPWPVELKISPQRNLNIGDYFQPKRIIGSGGIQ